MTYEIASTNSMQVKEVGIKVWEKYVAYLKGKHESRTNHADIYVEGMEDWEITTLLNVTPGHNPAIDFCVWDGRYDKRIFLQYKVGIPGLRNPDKSLDYNPFPQLYSRFNAIPGEYVNLSEFNAAVESVRKDLAGE